MKRSLPIEPKIGLKGLFVVDWERAMDAGILVVIILVSGWFGKLDSVALRISRNPSALGITI